MFSIYTITNNVNGKIYVGQTNNIERRWKQHIKYSTNSSKAVHKAIRKYGINQFSFEVIYQSKHHDHILEMEIYFIKEFKSIKNGYNMTEGGEGSTGYKHRPESLVKLGKSTKGNKNGMYGKQHSDTTKNIIREKAKVISSKTYELLTPNNEIINVTNLYEFCKERNLPYHNMLTKFKTQSGPFKKGRAKGWMIIKLCDTRTSARF